MSKSQIVRLIFRIIGIIACLGLMAAIIYAVVFSAVGQTAKAEEFSPYASIMYCPFRSYVMYVGGPELTYYSRNTSTPYVAIRQDGQTLYQDINWGGIDNSIYSVLASDYRVRDVTTGQANDNNYQPLGIASSVGGLGNKPNYASITHIWQPEANYDGPVVPDNIAIENCTVSLRRYMGPPTIEVSYAFKIVVYNNDTSMQTWTLGTWTIEEYVNPPQPTVPYWTFGMTNVPVFYFASGIPSDVTPTTYMNANYAYNNGYRNGYARGYQTSYQSGYDSGYNSGYNDGYTDGSKLTSGEQGVIGSANAIIRTVWSIVNVPLFGPNFTLGTLLAISVVIALVLFIIRMVRG